MLPRAVEVFFSHVSKLDNKYINKSCTTFIMFLCFWTSNLSFVDQQKWL